MQPSDPRGYTLPQSRCRDGRRSRLTVGFVLFVNARDDLTGKNVGLFHDLSWKNVGVFHDLELEMCYLSILPSVKQLV